MIQNLEINGCKGEEPKPKESVGFTRSKLARTVEKSSKSDFPDLVTRNMQSASVPSTSTYQPEEGILQDYFISWKRKTVSTICDKLSDRQRSAFIFVS